MKTKRWLTILMVLALYLSVKAQEYKEGLIYDLVGNVKDMKLNTKNKFLKKHVKFQKDTKIVRAVFEFKSKDGIQLIECEYSDYEYDAMGNWISRQVTQFQSETPDDKKLYTETRTLKYF